MKGTILVTDTLFIFDRHVERFEEAGYQVERLNEVNATEQQLVDAIKGKAGYILGGIEHVTKPVIDAGDVLRVVLFTGTGYKTHIPAWKHAVEKGIAVANSPYANVYEVAEWGVAATLALQRNLFGLGPRGEQSFVTENSLTDLTVGVIGLGRIGRKYADMMNGLGAKKVVYWNRSDKDTPHESLGKEALYKTADIIFVALADDAGENSISEKEMSLMKKDAILVSIAHEEIIDEHALYKHVASGHIRAALDVVADFEKFKTLPADRWYASNGSSAFNTWSFLNRCSDMATDTMINLLETGEDQYRIH